MKKAMEKIKELTKLIAQLNKLLIAVIEILGWIFIIVKLLE